MVSATLLNALLVLALVRGCSSTSSKANSPNFVMILFDDFGYGDWAATGSPALTPNLLEMIHSPHTLLFDRFYSGGPICSPTRASLQTGRTPSRTCIYSVEQHVLSRLEFGVANATKLRGYQSFFAGKWHLGSIQAASPPSTPNSNCYTPTSTTEDGPSCDPGFVSWGTLCCAGTDGHLNVSMPLNFGYDTMLATPQCGASATTNCGCFNHTTTSSFEADNQCIVGHYSDACSTCSYALECAQYFEGTQDSSGNVDVKALDHVSGSDDQEFIVDNFEQFMTNTTAKDDPFLAVLCFHGVHIPYVATQKYRDLYDGKNFTSNELDYYGTISSMDAAVGRIRSILREHQLDHNTMVVISSDNGPEVSPANGQGTGKPFINPGRTDGLRGRKRDLTEGGIRTIGIVEFPALIDTGTSDVTNISSYPASVMDVLPTMLDLLNVSHPAGWPIDGSSLVPVMENPKLASQIPKQQGFYGVFGYGTTNHNNGNPNPGCPLDFNKTHTPQVTGGFPTPGNQPQFAYMKDTYKLFGCRDKNDTKSWHFFLFDIEADRYETEDLYYRNSSRTMEIMSEFMEWQDSVLHSQGPAENDCHPGVPSYSPVPSMGDCDKRCSGEDGNFIGESSSADVDACASQCAGHHGCEYFSFSPTCHCCWLYRTCSQHDSSSTWKFQDWSTYQIS